MYLLLQYFKQRKQELTALAIFCMIFFAAFALYHLPLEAVAYPAGICAVLLLLFLAWDFKKVKERHRRLKNIKTFADCSGELLGQEEGIIAQEYQNIIQQLTQEHSQAMHHMNLRYDNMMDYYTIWAHQVKTPITSMKLQLQNEDTAFSRAISSDLFRTEQYVDMVLMFLKLDCGSIDYVIKEYDLDTIVRQAVKKFAGEFIVRKLSMTYHPLNEKVITDEKWLSFVIEQVLSNALKYTPDGGVEILLEEPKTLCIRDTGIGVAAEDLPRIFEKGYTGYNGRNDKKASGIGLYLCKRICANLGHRITAESESGKGMLIRLELAQKALEVE